MANYMTSANENLWARFERAFIYLSFPKNVEAVRQPSTRVKVTTSGIYETSQVESESECVLIMDRFGDQVHRDGQCGVSGGRPSDAADCCRKREPECTGSQGILAYAPGKDRRGDAFNASGRGRALRRQLSVRRRCVVFDRGSYD